MKILLVEDTRSVAAVMQARLASYGYEVVLAPNGSLGVDAFPDLSPDLVLMDIEMPVMNGFEATHRIRALEATQKWAWTPIIFLTASDTPENLVTAIGAGGDDFIAKNVPETVLHAKMKAMERIAGLSRQLSAANRKLEELASRDGLTGLCNRRYMDLQLDIAWTEAKRRGQGFGLLMLDVDNFKKYNDHYGHLLGDDCLRAVATAIAVTVDRFNHDARTKGAFAARYGGEEFTVILPGVSAAAYQEMAAAIIESLRGCAIPHDWNAAFGIVTVSIGGARLERVDGEIKSLFRTADTRLYQAKSGGRNQAVLAD